MTTFVLALLGSGFVLGSVADVGWAGGSLGPGEFTVWWVGRPVCGGHGTEGPALPGGERREGQREQRAVERGCVLGEEEGAAGNDKFMVTDCYLDTLEAAGRARSG